MRRHDSTYLQAASANARQARQAAEFLLEYWGSKRRVLATEALLLHRFPARSRCDTKLLRRGANQTFEGRGEVGLVPEP